MDNLIDLAKKYSSNGFSVIPVTKEKLPFLGNWKKYIKNPMTLDECEKYFKNAKGIALLMGGQKNLTALDFDLKYDLSGDFFERYKNIVNDNILKKMYVQSTKNKGYHFILSCEKIEGNQKLASRYTTAYEKHRTYLEAYSTPRNRDKALKVASNDSTRVLMETRGEGGYVVISPTEGYKYIHGKINKISIEEYDILFEAARSLDETKIVKKDIRLDNYEKWSLSPFTDYDQRGDVLRLLDENGWEDVGNAGKSVRLKRPGSSHSKSSALFDTETRLFNCFSTSTHFDVSKSYNPSDLFIELECEGDLSVAFKKLIEQEFGKE